MWHYSSPWLYLSPPQCEVRVYVGTCWSFNTLSLMFGIIIIRLLQNELQSVCFTIKFSWNNILFSQEQKCTQTFFQRWSVPALTTSGTRSSVQEISHPRWAMRVTALFTGAMVPLVSSTCSSWLIRSVNASVCLNWPGCILWNHVDYLKHNAHTVTLWIGSALLMES